MKALKIRLVAALGVVVLSAPIVGAAQPSETRPSPRTGSRSWGEAMRDRSGSRADMHGMMLARVLASPELAEKVGLGREQAAALREHMQEIRAQMQDLHSRLEATGLEQARLMTESVIDEEAVMAAVEQAGEINTQMAKARMRQLLLVRKVLSPEQIENVRLLIRQRVKKRMEQGDAAGRRRPERREKPVREGLDPESREPAE